MMKSPFPGMDPYLEAYWSDVHVRLTTYASDAIQRRLPGDLQARIEDLVYIEDSMGEDRYVAPDVLVVERPDLKAGQGTENGGGVAVSSPIIVHLADQERHLRSIRVIDPKSGGRLITSIEFLSPANKSSGKGQDLFLQKQRELTLGGVNLVEIDLTRAGSRVMLLKPEFIPPEARTTYQVCIRRAHRPHAIEIHRVPLRERLPNIPIPLREREPDVTLDLQELINLAFENGRYGNTDYTKEPVPPLSGSDADWADGLLRGQGLR